MSQSLVLRYFLVTTRPKMKSNTLMNIFSSEMINSVAGINMVNLFDNLFNIGVVTAILIWVIK